MSSVWLFCISTICCILSACIQAIVNQILTVTHRESIQCKDLRKEMIAIKQEMSQFSMMDEFARHARLQRKLIKLQQEWKDEANTVSSSKMQVKLMSTLSARAILGLVTLIVVYLYRYETVLELPEEWLYPISSFLSWPSGKAGAVSLPSWLLISGSASKYFASLLS